MKRYDVYLTEQQLIDLNTLSLSNGLKVSKNIRKAIDEYLTRNLHKQDTHKFMCDNCGCETEHDQNDMCIICKCYD